MNFRPLEFLVINHSHIRCHERVWARIFLQKLNCQTKIKNKQITDLPVNPTLNSIKLNSSQIKFIHLCEIMRQ